MGAIYRLGERALHASGEFYVAPGARVIGSVRLGQWSSVWFNSVLRADNDWIVIGDGTNVQDSSVIHTDAGTPVEVGANVSIGHGVILHGCAIGDRSLVANGCIILDRVTVGKECVIAAGTLLPPGKIVPDRSVVMGAPGTIVRQVTDSDLAVIRETAEHYKARSRLYRQGLAMDNVSLR